MLLVPSPSSSSTRGRRPAATDSSSPRSRPLPSTGPSTAAGAVMLPDDVLARCLAYLSSPLELAAAGAACCAWRGVARGDDLWWPFVVRAWPSLRRFLPPWALASSTRSSGSTQPNAPAQPVIRGSLCRLFALRLPLKPGQEDDDDAEEHEAGGHGMCRPYASSSDDHDSDSSSSEHAGARRQTARVSLGRTAAATEASSASSATAGAGVAGAAAAQAGPQTGRRRQLQVPLRADDVVLHIEIRDLDEDDEDGGLGAVGAGPSSWRRRLGVGRPLYSAAFCLADPRAFWLAVYNATRYRPRTLPGAVVDARRLAALLSDNLDELDSPLLKIDVAALHLPTGAVLHLPWRHSTLQLVQSFSLEEAEPNLHPHSDDDDDEEEDSNAIRLILDGGTRGPVAKARGQRLDLSFCPAIDLPTGDPSHPRPAILRTAPVELRFYDFQLGEYLDETGLGDRGQATSAVLRFLAAVGSGGGGWRA